MTETTETPVETETTFVRVHMAGRAVNLPETLQRSWLKYYNVDDNDVVLVTKPGQKSIAMVDKITLEPGDIVEILKAS